MAQVGVPGVVGVNVGPTGTAASAPLDIKAESGIGSGAPSSPQYMDDALFQRHIQQKVDSNNSATMWLIGLGLVLLILGILLQLIFCNWWWSVVWAIGIVLLIAGAATYASGSQSRWCLSNPVKCRKLLEAVSGPCYQKWP